MFERLKRRFQRHRADADIPASSERATDTNPGDASATPTAASAAPPAPPAVWQGAASPANPPAAADTPPPASAEQEPGSEPASAALPMPGTDQEPQSAPTEAAAAVAAAASTAQPGRELVMIDERRYVLSEFPEELRQLLFNLRRADELLRIHRNRVVVLNQGSKALRERVRQELALHPTLAEATDAVSATAPDTHDAGDA